MKSLFILILSLAISILVVGCGEDGDSLIVCDNFQLKIRFRDSLGDITGDTIFGNVQFLKDSITYEIVSSVVNVPVTKAMVTCEISNVFTTQPFDLSGISNKETVFVIFHLNATVSDTLRMEIVDKVDLACSTRMGRLISDDLQIANCHYTSTDNAVIAI